jgi:phenylacetate-CoA ligase
MATPVLPGTQSSQESSRIYNDYVNSLFILKSESWSAIQSKRLNKILQETSKNIPVYKDFLIKSGVNIKKLKIDKTPSFSKKNFLRLYKWVDLCKKKVFQKKSLVLTATSGSTGTPFYFPRVEKIDLQSSVSHQLFFQISRIKKKESTLVIDCFGMGVWIGGLITYQAFKHMGERGFPVTIITPGINKAEIYQAIKSLGSFFDHIIICGYPPFIKDLADEAQFSNVFWKKYSIKVIFAAESFSESFREYITKKMGIKNMYRDMMNIYGSAELGSMAQETPLTILLRRLAVKNKKLYSNLFNQANRLPTFAQYIPDFINFEAPTGVILCTADNALPLVRYDIGDQGGVLSFNDVLKACINAGVDIKEEIKKTGLEDTITELPFVYVYERSDFSTTLYGALVYPEYIKKGLASKISSQITTGKFTMFTKNDKNENQYLEINLELKRNVTVNSKTKNQVLKDIHTTLLKQSSEYKKLYETIGSRVYPKLVFYKYGDETHFSLKGKQKWIGSH